ncbi:type II secretion system F family protein [Rheinheimera baltica]|uniref:Type II secretion system F family protein n=1 Tax=Rheinheimera baltica TaxID=67576 RepID=A0ABT9HUX2_9GAMM|nr:type II secretion system F family protein [Rheinheimera baltica]MDP5134927.1 type II secretion system F family protein [Rheinheimera baltica]MDP5149822.1 type II secretion system F family protein [Rheinheimera baltica]
MSVWEYDAIDDNGSRLKGRVRADTEQQALALVNQQQLSPLKIRQIKTEQGLFNRIKANDIEQLVTELALLLRNGVQLDRALDIMSGSTPNTVASEMLAAITESVRTGAPLFKAFSKYPRYFDTLFCEMVRIGEESGQLATTMERLGHNLKFQNDLKNKITQAMVYPGFVLAVCILSLFAIFNFIVPSMQGLFANMRDIPPYTQFLISTSEWVQNNQLLLLIFTFITVAAIFRSWREPGFQNFLQVIIRRTPVIKQGVFLGERIRFVSSMQLMLQSGLTLAKALEFSVNVVKDHRVKRQLERIKSEVSNGKMLSDALAVTDILEPVMLSLVKVGEESGRLDIVFTEMNERSRRKFEQWAMKLTSMLEPILIIVMGGLVGSVVVTMLLSIVSTTDVPL